MQNSNEIGIWNSVLEKFKFELQLVLNKNAAVGERKLDREATVWVSLGLFGMQTESLIKYPILYLKPHLYNFSLKVATIEKKISLVTVMLCFVVRLIEMFTKSLYS